MFTVQYTIAKTVKGKFVNEYKNQIFGSMRTAELYAAKMEKKKNVTDVRLIQSSD